MTTTTPLPTLSHRPQSNGSVEEDEIKDEKRVGTPSEQVLPSAQKLEHSSEDAAVTEVLPPVVIPWKLKWFALLMTSCLCLGSNCTSSPCPAARRRSSETDSALADC